MQYDSFAQVEERLWLYHAQLSERHDAEQISAEFTEYEEHAMAV
jgi:hypothetical protein